MWMTITALLFGNCDLGSHRFAAREVAQATLTKYWPITEPLLAKYRASTDLEVSTRARRATPAMWLRYKKLGFNKCLAYQIIYEVGSSDIKELPWMSQEELDVILRNKSLFDAVKAVATENGLLRENEVIWYGSTTGVYYPYCDIDRVRFRAMDLGEKAWVSGSYTPSEIESLLKQWEKRFVQTPHIAR